MTKHPHPITPPPELVEQWRTEPEFAELGRTTGVSMTQSRLRDIATKAAQWGADHELEACCEWLARNYNYPRADHPLRVARRPKPPSLKEQALKALDHICVNHSKATDHEYTIRCALEALPE